MGHFNLYFQNALYKHAPVKSIKIRYRKCPFLGENLNN